MFAARTRLELIHDIASVSSKSPYGMSRRAFPFEWRTVAETFNRPSIAAPRIRLANCGSSRQPYTHSASGSIPWDA